MSEAALSESTIDTGAAVADRILSQLQSTREPDLSDLKQQCLERSDGDLHEAAMIFVREISTKYPAFHAQFLNRAVVSAAIALLQHHAKNVRDSIVTAGTTKPNPGQPCVHAMAVKSYADGWMKWQLRPGRMLATATRADIAEVAKYYLTKGKTMLARGAFLDAIAGSLKNDTTTVADVFNEQKLAALARKHGVVK